MPLHLAIDQSTSGTKALLFDADGQLLDRESKEHRQYYPQPGWVEHDAAEIWENVLHVLRELLGRHPAAQDHLETLSLTNQRETVVVFDRITGQPLHPAIVWQCRRGDGICAAHAAAGQASLVRLKTGLELDAYFSASKMQWLMENQPALRQRLLDGSALLGTIDAYLIHRLTGGRTFATDSTNASRTLLYDIGRLRWDETLCSLFQVPPQALPEVRESFAEFGHTTLEGILRRPLVIRGVMGDSQASLFALRCFESGAAKVTFGTGSSLLLNIGHQLRFSGNGVVTTLAWVKQGQPTYAFEGIIISSAATLTWLRDQLGLVRDIAELEKLATEVPDNGGVYLVPAFTGLGLPHWRPAARALIAGLSSHSDRRHVARAAIESIAYQVRDALDALRSDAGVPLRALHADGGATANQMLMQFTADLTGLKLHVATMADCSALGAMLAGQAGSDDRLENTRLASLPRNEKIYQPAMPPETARQLYSGWQAAIAQV